MKKQAGRVIIFCIVRKRSYYGFNREKILTNAWGKYHNKGGKKKLLSIIKII